MSRKTSSDEIPDHWWRITDARDDSTDTVETSQQAKQHEIFHTTRESEEQCHENENSIKTDKVVGYISHSPVVCPISNCLATVGVTSVLAHFLGNHCNDCGLEFQPIHGTKRVTLVFPASSLKFGENTCLGLLAYGGATDEEGKRPADLGICLRNSFLSTSMKHLERHLPIMIMACKTSWAALIADESIALKLSDAENAEQHLVVLWLVSVETTKKIPCTLTAYNVDMSASRSVVVNIRNLNESQRPEKFLKTDVNYLRLSRGEVNILSHHETEMIHFEATINL